MKPALVIASRNKGKIKDFRRLLADFEIKLIALPEHINIKETGSTFLENARIKALEASKITGEWALADDSGLCVSALNGAPGIYSARYGNSDLVRITKLLQELNGIAKRKAYFTCAICVCIPENNLLIEVEEKCEGLIAEAPRGLNGFGYDPVFEVEGTGLTFAEMSVYQKQRLSHRARAFYSLDEKLKELFS